MLKTWLEMTFWKSTWKDAKMGISRATSLFILYIGQAAMEIANDNKRKTVKESDVLKALEGIYTYRSLNSSLLSSRTSVPL